MNPSSEPTDSMTGEPGDVPAQLIYVVSDLNGGEAENANHAIGHELDLCNQMMTEFPGHVFLARSTFIMTELFKPRANAEWGNFYQRLVECCDAVYGHDGFAAHPLIDYAEHLGVNVLHDMWDVGSFIESQREL